MTVTEPILKKLYSLASSFSIIASLNFTKVRQNSWVPETASQTDVQTWAAHKTFGLLLREECAITFFRKKKKFEEDGNVVHNFRF